jgi:hypothetical protein
MARKLLTPEEIGRAAAAIEAKYYDRAVRVTKDDLRRWQRMQEHPVGHALFNEAMRLADRIPNAQLATDIFEHIAGIYRSRIERRPGKRAGPHNPAEDQFLLLSLDLARKGGLPGQSKPWSKAEFAQHAAVSGCFGGASAIERRLTKRITERNKRAKRNKQRNKRAK